MDVYLAAQPIFARDSSVYGYEILYRESKVNKYEGFDEDQATSKVLLDSFHTIGLKNFTGGKPAFINFSGELLKKEIITLFSPQDLVVEILETAVPDESLFETCKKLKSKGYRIALDDFLLKENYQKIVALADIVKVDFLHSSWLEIEETTRYLKCYGKKNVILLAEKIETRQMFQKADELGYVLFQGYFFAKPVIVSAKDLPPAKTNYLMLLNHINQKEIDYEIVAGIIGRDVSLSYKLLKFVNSAFFGLRRKVKTIKEALVLLGEENLRKWLHLIILKGADQEGADEVVRHALIRAKFGENVSSLVGLEAYAADLFLIGLFSMLDVLFGRPLPELIKELPLSFEVQEALTEGTGRLANVLSLALAWEKGEFTAAVQREEVLGLKQGETMGMFLDALIWSNKVLENV